LLVGAVLVAFAQLLLALLGIGFGSVALCLVVAAVAAIGVRRLAWREPLGGDARMERRELAGWVLLGAVLAAASIRSWLVPEAGWDAFSHWGLRAQAYALSQTIVSAHSEHEYYPPLVPLLEAWLYLHRGAVSIDLGKTIWAALGSAFSICLAWHLRLTLAPSWVAPFIAIATLVSTTALIEGFWTGQADLPLTAFLTLATLATFQWQRSRSRHWLLQAGLFAAAAALTKFEGAPRIGVVVIALLVEAALARPKRTLLPAGLLTLTAGAATLLWTLFELTHGITPNAEHLGQFQPLALGGVLLSMAAVFGGVRTGGGLLIAALLWLSAGRRIPRLLVLVVAGQLGATLLAFLLSDTAPEIAVRTTATRLVEHFLPLALFAGAVGLIGDRGRDARGERQSGRQAANEPAPIIGGGR
jgi:hypothetical protein